MSTTDADPPLDMGEQLVRIDRAIAETRKFVAGHDKLAEAKKYERERLTILIVASAAVGAVLASLLGHFTIVLPGIRP